MRDTFAGRLKNLQGGTSDKEMSMILKNKYGIVKSEELVKKWRNGERTPNADVVLALSDYYGVSADYLLGRNVPKSKDPDVKMICAYTGLSEAAVEVLHYETLLEFEGPLSHLSDIELDQEGKAMTLTEDSEGKPTAEYYKNRSGRTASFINRVLERIHVPAPEDRDGEELSNILTDMEDYVTMESAWIDDSLNEGTNELITVHYGGKTLRGLRVWEVIKIDLLARIEKSLDTIRNEHFNTMSMKKPRKRKQAQRTSEGSDDIG